MVGFSFTYGQWSSAVKGYYGYSQEQLNNLALAKDLGTFICMDAGVLTGRFGSHVTLGMAGLGVTLSCAAIYAGLQTQIPYLAMLFLFWLFGHSLAFADNSGISTSIALFPKHKGMACGLMKAFEGITAAVMACVFSSLFAESQLDYYPLILSIVGLIIGVVATPIMYLTYEPAKEPTSVLTKKFTILGTVIMAYAIFCGVIGYTKAYNFGTMAVCLSLLLGLYLLVIPMGGDENVEAVRIETTGPARVASNRPNVPVREMLATLDFYFLFVTFIALLGAGMMFSNNLAQIVKAVKGDAAASAGFYVTIFSVFSTTGRVVMGFGSESIKSKINRPWFVSFCAFMMAIGMTALRFGEAALAPAAALAGFSLGGGFALMAVVVEEIFGPAQLPLKYACCYFACSFGSLIFGTLIAGEIYDDVAKKHHEDTCLGDDCFAVTFDASAAGCALGVVLSAAVAYRSRDIYAKLHSDIKEPLCIDGAAAS